MSRKNKKTNNAVPLKSAKPFPEAISAAGEGGIGKKGAWIIAVAVIVIISGYVFLFKAAPDGRDAFSSLAAAFLTAGYLLIPVGIMA